MSLTCNHQHSASPGNAIPAFAQASIGLYQCCESTSYTIGPKNCFALFPIGTFTPPPFFYFYIIVSLFCLFIEPHGTHQPWKEVPCDLLQRYNPVFNHLSVFKSFPQTERSRSGCEINSFDIRTAYDIITTCCLCI